MLNLSHTLCSCVACRVVANSRRLWCPRVRTAPLRVLSHVADLLRCHPKGVPDFLLGGLRVHTHQLVRPGRCVLRIGVVDFLIQVGGAVVNMCSRKMSQNSEFVEFLKISK